MTAYVQVSTSKARAHYLVPSYDRESDILAVSSNVDADWVFGVDIDGSIVFDLDSSRRLVNFDVHIPMSLWKPCRLGAWPDSVEKGSVLFARETVAHKSFHLPLRLLYDDARQLVLVEIGTGSTAGSRIGQPQTVALSDCCIALVIRERLAGFLVRLVQ